MGPVEKGSADFIWNHGTHRSGHWAWKTHVSSEPHWEETGPPSPALLCCWLCRQECCPEPLTPFPPSRAVRGKHWAEDGMLFSCVLIHQHSCPLLCLAGVGRYPSFLVLKWSEACVWGRGSGKRWGWGIWKPTHHAQIVFKIWRLFIFYCSIFNWHITLASSV